MLLYQPKQEALKYQTHALNQRSDRFIEEALEFVQAAGYTAERAHALVDYTFGRPQGEVNQEVGGVMVTLAAMCNTLKIGIGSAAEAELARVWTKIDTIRAKQAAKPTGSALPVALSKPSDDAVEKVAMREALVDIANGCGMLSQPAELNCSEEAWLRRRIEAYERTARAALEAANRLSLIPNEAKERGAAAIQLWWMTQKHEPMHQNDAADLAATCLRAMASKEQS